MFVNCDQMSLAVQQEELAPVDVFCYWIHDVISSGRSEAQERHGLGYFLEIRISLALSEHQSNLDYLIVSSCYQKC